MLVYLILQYLLQIFWNFLENIHAVPTSYALVPARN